MERKLKVAAAILAGGQSSRFGVSKLEAVLKGKRLIDYAIATAEKISSDVRIICGAHAMPPDITCPCHSDVIAQCGPLGGILTALSYSSNPFVAILPVDMPLLPSPVYHLLLEKCDGERPVVARSQRGIEPLVSIWPALLLPTVREHVEAGHLKMIEAMNALDAVVVDITASLAAYREEWFLNINRQDDLEHLKRLMKRE